MWNEVNGIVFEDDGKFRYWMYRELDIELHPKRKQLFHLAWEYGHSSGYSEVYSYALDLVELIKD